MHPGDEEKVQNVFHHKNINFCIGVKIFSEADIRTQSLPEHTFFLKFHILKQELLPLVTIHKMPLLSIILDFFLGSTQCVYKARSTK